ncbi:MAG: hypothetical protein JF608_08365 [Sphingomonadales bacterium]|nr:hypothetical protein [Sphingomonadales bacterium]
MAACALVVSAYTDLRDALTALAMRTADSDDRNILLQRAVVAGSLAEQCDTRFSGRDVAGGGDAIDKANHASQEAGAASGTDSAQIQQVIADADAASAALQRIVTSASIRANVSGNLIGSLRITPAPRSLVRAGGNFAIAAAETPKTSSPGYVTDVAKLFPVEAAAIFPLGQSIAGNDPVALSIIIAATALFVVALRYFATQQDGKPAWNEIGGALISLLLWIGATKGYWVDKGWIDIGISADMGGKLYGFVTIIWVALAPYLVMEKSKRDAAR